MELSFNREDKIEPVTVVVINFNGEEILGETLSSIKRLKYPELSIILIDDGSTDRSLEIVERDFPDVRIINIEVNTGRLNKLRNIGKGVYTLRKMYGLELELRF